MNTKLQDAKDRIEKMGFTQAEQDFIFSDWPNWDEHLTWLLVATRKEIKDWIKANK